VLTDLVERDWHLRLAKRARSILDESRDSNINGNYNVASDIWLLPLRLESATCARSTKLFINGLIVLNRIIAVSRSGRFASTNALEDP
jgi:hypothetical protein